MWKFFAVLYGNAAALMLALYVALVHVWPGEHIRREHIVEVVSRESPVFYRDGREPLGTFFASEHRRYVGYQEMPGCLLDGIVAAEDATFYSHPGFNPFSIARAMLANVKASIRAGRPRLVQGGSTLTQQTAKNLFKRRGRTLREKLRELLNALRLEAHYSKKEILEFYLNQFYVNANGRGVGIASEYFFNKEPADLTLTECAFIAGSVKGPDYYNPAIQRTPEAAERARERAEIRKNYVLRRMREERFITEDEYEEARAKPVPFDIGRFRFPRSIILDEVERRLREPDLAAVLEEAGIGDLNTAGLRIITTLDHDIQEGALRAVRTNLSRLKLYLEGYHPPRQSGEEAPELRAERVFELEPGRFYRGQITALDPARPSIDLQFGSVAGVLDRQGLLSCVAPIEQGSRGTWYSPTNADIAKFVKARTLGELLYVVVREPAREGAPARVDCLIEPTREDPLQGGIVVLEQGRFRAVVGSYYNTNYNRATIARRQPGSAFKPIVYLAALSLGWSITDVLPNERELFEFASTVYMPRPDHEGEPEVSLAWAGVKSENVASVWLLHHLTDRLNPEQFAALAAEVGLGQRAGESEKDFTRRIRDEEGIAVTDRMLEEAAFHRVRDQLVTDLVFKGEVVQAAELKALHFGVGFNEKLERYKKEREPLLRRMESATGAIKATLDRRIAALDLRIKLYSRSYLHWISLYERCTGEDGDPLEIEGCNWRKETIERFLLPDSTNWYLDGLFEIGTLAELRERVGEAKKELVSGERYSMATLSQVPDFRVLVSLRYVKGLTKLLGVESPIDAVLSFPLGVNVVTLEELARAYESAGTGLRWGANDEHPGGRAFLIQEIQDAEGRTLYRLEAKPELAVPSELSAPWREILENVVKWGTGRRIDRELLLRSTEPERDAMLARREIRVPAFGKTGTSNDYTNATFAGLLPYFDEEGLEPLLDPAHAFSIAAYVGYDDNRPMRAPSGARIAGASGALPAWLDTAQAIVRARAYELHVDPFALEYIRTRRLSVKKPEDAVALAVDEARGLPIVPVRVAPAEEFEADGIPYLSVQGEVDEQAFEPERIVHILPVRRFLQEGGAKGLPGAVQGGAAESAVLGPAGESAGD